MINSDSFRNRRLFLSSNSVYKDLKYLEHTVTEMARFVGDVSEIIFIPFAAVAERSALDKQWAEYNLAPEKAFSEFGIKVTSLHTIRDRAAKIDQIRRAEAVFIGGGNSHHLLYWLKTFDLLEALRERLDAGVPMMGSSAGTNVFCPTIRTTNDMPIVALPDLNSIGGIPFQINPHYMDPDPDSDHRGETRQQRIEEFIKVDGGPVLGLREGAWLRVENGEITLEGLSGARFFRADQEPLELVPVKNITQLVRES